jgi:hypothetical protein
VQLCSRQVRQEQWAGCSCECRRHSFFELVLCPVTLQPKICGCEHQFVHRVHWPSEPIVVECQPSPRFSAFDIAVDLIPTRHLRHSPKMRVVRSKRGSDHPRSNCRRQLLHSKGHAVMQTPSGREHDSYLRVRRQDEFQYPNVLEKLVTGALLSEFSEHLCRCTRRWGAELRRNRRTEHPLIRKG